MNANKDDRRNPRFIYFFGVALPMLPRLMVRFTGAFLRFKSHARRGGRFFHKELLQQGVDKETAEKLTERYLEGGNLFQYIPFFQ